MDFCRLFETMPGNNITLELSSTYNGDELTLPYYYFDIRHNASKRNIGNITVRIGESFNATYAGHLDVTIKDDFRGHRYSYEAALLAMNIFRHHEMSHIYISCSESNFASRKVIELLGAQLLEVSKPPLEFTEWNPNISSYAIYCLDVPPANFLSTVRSEHSSMAIVFCSDKILTLMSNDGKLNLPKGHIEENETSLKAAIRECEEETGVMLSKREYKKQVEGVEYSFTGENFKHMTDIAFYGMFGVAKINKKVDVHVFVIKNQRSIIISEKKYFRGGSWMPIDEFLKTSTYQDQITAVQRALAAI